MDFITQTHHGFLPLPITQTEYWLGKPNRNDITQLALGSNQLNGLVGLGSLVLALLQNAFYFFKMYQIQYMWKQIQYGMINHSTLASLMPVMIVRFVFVWTTSFQFRAFLVHIELLLFRATGVDNLSAYLLSKSMAPTLATTVLSILNLGLRISVTFNSWPYWG